MKQKLKFGKYIGERRMLLVPRYVQRWGYDNDFSTEVALAYTEAGGNLDERVVFLARDHKKNFIFSNHLDMRKFFDKWKEMVAIDSSTTYRSELERLKLGLVNRFIRERTQKYAHQPRERKLFFREFVLDKEESFYVMDVKHVHTGRYVPAAGGGDDCEAPYLADRKVHVLLNCERCNEGAFSSYWLLARDTITVEEYINRKKIAERLRDSA
jgi:hypothetical protein